MTKLLFHALAVMTLLTVAACGSAPTGHDAGRSLDGGVERQDAGSDAGCTPAGAECPDLFECCSNRCTVSSGGGPGVCE
ncbi:MAG: hypothetical protein ACFCGT_16275 [Sandaracinaceae bacterium]